MANKDLVVVGASAGGIDALRALARSLPADLTSCIMIVLHAGAGSPDILDRILAAEGPLPASNALNMQEVEPGHIYVAPGDHHMLLDASGRLRLTRGPKENRVRPAADVLFRSAAYAFGPRVVGVILSGWLDDGTAGLWAVKARGGTAIVQRPDEALVPAMPTSAVKNVEVDHVVPVEKMGGLLARLAATPAEERGMAAPSKLMSTEVRIAQEEEARQSGFVELAEPSLFACTECHGVLLKLEEGSHVRVRCHTGHAYSLESLLCDFGEKGEEALWSAIRTLEENIMLLREAADNMQGHGHRSAADTLRRKADEIQDRAKTVRRALAIESESSQHSPAPPQ